MKSLFSVLVLAAAVLPVRSQETTPAAPEKSTTTATAAAAPVPIFDGKSLAGWTTVDGKPAPDGWKAENGVLHRAAKAGDIYSAKEYTNFELVWEWKISPGGNGGLKYRMREYPGKGWLGIEYQLLDDEKHADAKIGLHRQTASFYDLIAPAADKKLNPAGEWNQSKIVVRGSRLEHWLNGVKTGEVDQTGDVWKAAHAKSKFKGVADFALNPTGRIMIQDHGDEIWLRNLTILELPVK